LEAVRPSRRIIAGKDDRANKGVEPTRKAARLIADVPVWKNKQISVLTFRRHGVTMKA